MRCQVQDFHNLQVWTKAHALTLRVYQHTMGFPREELYGLTMQMRRAAASVPTNIAEGCGRGGPKELAQFCQIALGSASELEYQLLLARDLGYLDKAAHEALNSDATEIKRMLASLISRLRAT
jgi:four helix bundle protein